MEEPKSSKKSYYVCIVNETEAKALRKALVDKDFYFRDVPYSKWGAYNKEVNVTLYNKGKLVIQGKGTQDFVQFFLEPEILKKIEFGYEAHFAVEEGVSHIGVDESGKGDYFGPLVIASVYVEKEQLGILLDAGVKDSKKLSEKVIARLSKMIRCQCPFSLVVIGPEKYNQLYEKIKNLNKLLAWAHARAIENLLEKTNCQDVVIDQFGNERLVINALMKKGKEIKLTQRHHGEEDIAVAAASIVARFEFVQKMKELGESIGKEVFRGAGAQVLELAEKLYKEKGIEEFSKMVKLHFNLTQKIMSKRDEIHEDAGGTGDK